MDPYLSSLFASKDCDRKRYRPKKKWPEGCNALEEVDKALLDDTFDLMQLVRPRMVATECPLLIDSRCRILRPDPPSQEDVEKGTILGTAVISKVVRLLLPPSHHRMDPAF